MTAPGADPSPGSAARPELLGEHEVVRVIARGGMGSVSLVRNRRTGVAYAAKMILRAEDPLARDRFRREAELLARVDKHAGVVKVHAYGETQDGTPYMILDLVIGEGLDRVLEREAPLEARRAAELARQIAAALGFVHDLGVVHRDVKPSNVLLENHATAKLTDFGLATARDVERLTRTGVFLGTFAYSAPEQATGAAGRASPRADVYGLGAILFQMLSGQTPIEAESPMEAIAKLAAPEPIRDVRVVAPSVPPPLAAIVARALSKNPAERFANGAEMEIDLAHFLAGRRPSSSTIIERPRARRRARWLVGAGLALALGVGAVLALVALGEGSRRGRAALDEARAAALEAQTALARASRAQGKGNEPDLLAHALERARAGLEAATAASALGLPEAAAVSSEAAATLGEAMTRVAEQRLAAGQVEAALAVFPASGRAPAASLPISGHLVRARAFLALNRPAEAASEATVVASSSGPLRADGAETLGEALALQNEFAKAQAAFTRALELGPRRPTEARIRRGTMAASAGDDRTALADLSVLAPDLTALSPAPGENARLAGLAPALYRRGLATDGPGSERDLEAAFRLAPPPSDLAPALVQRWLELSLRESDQWAQTFVGEMHMDEAVVSRLIPVFRRVAHARAVQPRCDVRPFWDTFALLRNWVRNTDAAIVERVARNLAAVWPDQPIFDYMLASALRKSPSLTARREALIMVFKAAREIPPAEPGENPDVNRLSAYIVGLGTDLSTELDQTGPTEEAALRALCERCHYADAWIGLCRFFSLSGRVDPALDALDHVPGLLGLNDVVYHADKIVRERVQTLCVGRRFPQAHALVESLPADQAVVKLRLACLTLTHERRWADIVGAVDQGQVFDDETLLYLGEAFCELGRTTDARAVQARLERMGSDVTPTLRIYMEDASQRKLK